MIASNRKQYLDIAKGIGIIAVILGHTVTHGSFAFNMIFSFHMPLFFIISGILFKKQETRNLLKKRYESLLVPYITTVLILLPFALLKEYVKEGQTDLMGYFLSVVWGAGFKMSNPSSIKPIGAIWFLLAMFWAQIIYNYSPTIQWKKLLYCLPIAVIGYVIGMSYWLPTDLCVGMTGIVFLYLGELSKKLLDMGGAIVLIFLGVWVIGWTETLGMVSNTYPFFFFSILTAFAGCIVVLRISIYLEHHSLNYPSIVTYLSYMGRYSLSILCFHLLELSIIPLKLLVPSVALRCIIRVVMLSFIPLVVSRIPLLANYYKLDVLKK